jgi:hypothetical protein
VEIIVKNILKNLTFYVVATIVILLTLILYIPAFLLSLIWPSKIRVKGLTILVGEVGKEVFGIGFGW